MGKHRVPPGGPKGPDEVDYDTGYRKPPKDGQFKKGQSGNKAGRPKAAPNTRTALSGVLGNQLNVQTAEGSRTMTVTEFLLTALVKEGAKGKVSAIKQLFDMARDLDVGLEQPDAHMSADDEKHFDDLVAALQGAAR